jgi:hypothetical protein
VLILVLSVLAAPGASAAAKPSLPPRAAVFVVGGDRASASEAEALEVQLTRALDDAKVELTDLESLFPTPPIDDSGKALMAEAKAAFDDLDFAAALEKAQAALEAFTAHPDSADAASLAELHLFIGAVSMQLEGKAAAKRAHESFARALLFDPDLTLDERRYGKDAGKVFARAQQDVSGRGTGALTVSSSPAGAEVLLRDKPVGLTPLSEALPVPVGRHLVKLTRAGYGPTGVFVDVTPSGATVHAILAPAVGYGNAVEAATRLAQDGIGSGKVPVGAKKLGDVMKARFLVMGVKRGGETPVEVWDVETGNRLTGLSVADAAAMAATAARVKDFVDHPSPLAPAVVQKEQGGGGPLYQKWWFWTAVGVVVVGGATAAGVAAASGSRPGYNVILGIP